MSGSVTHLFIYYLLCVACEGVGLRKGMLGATVWEQREAPLHRQVPLTSQSPQISKEGVGTGGKSNPRDTVTRQPELV